MEAEFVAAAARVFDATDRGQNDTVFALWLAAQVGL